VMCFCTGHGSFGWHFTTVVSVVFPVRASTQWCPFHRGVKTRFYEGDDGETACCGTLHCAISS